MSRPQKGMSMTAFDPNKHPRDTGGRFAAKGYSEADESVSLGNSLRDSALEDYGLSVHDVPGLAQAWDERYRDIGSLDEDARGVLSDELAGIENGTIPPWRPLADEEEWEEASAKIDDALTYTVAARHDMMSAYTPACQLDQYLSGDIPTPPAGVSVAVDDDYPVTSAEVEEAVRKERETAKRLNSLSPDDDAFYDAYADHEDAVDGVTALRVSLSPATDEWRSRAEVYAEARSEVLRLEDKRWALGWTGQGRPPRMYAPGGGWTAATSEA